MLHGIVARVYRIDRLTPPTTPDGFGSGRTRPAIDGRLVSSPFDCYVGNWSPSGGAGTSKALTIPDRAP